MDAFLAGRGNVATGVRPLLDNIADRRSLSPSVPRGKGYVVSTPYHLRSELGGRRLNVPESIACYGVGLYDELSIVRSGNESAAPAIFVVQLLPRSGINE